MKFKYTLTSSIKKFIANSNLEEIKIGCSDSKVIKIEKAGQVYFLKMAKKGIITAEYNKLNWLNSKLKVPTTVLYDCTDNEEFLITEAIKGSMVCSDEYLNNPDIGIKIIIEAFKNIYAVDIIDCPFDVSIDYKLSLVESNVKNNLISVDSLQKETIEKYGTLENILKYLKENKFNDPLCFSHGDTSLPNIFASADKFSGFIDVGECGLCDKWFDLAICEKSIRRNYGEENILKFYQALNIIPDRKKIDYYLLMMELYL